MESTKDIHLILDAQDKAILTKCLHNQSRKCLGYSFNYSITAFKIVFAVR